MCWDDDWEAGSMNWMRDVEAWIRTVVCETKEKGTDVSKNLRRRTGRSVWLWMRRGRDQRKKKANRSRSVGDNFKKEGNSGWCGSVDWVLACKPKGCWFDFQSRAHAWVMGQVSSVGGVCDRDNHTLLFLSLSISLPSPLSKINKILKKKQERNLHIKLILEVE